MTAGPRRAIPTEIDALLTGRKLTTTVFFLDDKFEEITYDMATTVADAIEELAGIVKLSTYSSFRLYECQKVVTSSKSPDSGNEEEFFMLDDNEHIGGLLAYFKAVKDRIKLQLDYILGNYAIEMDAASKLSALQILAEIGFVSRPESWDEWDSFLERFLPRQIAMTRVRGEWESDILFCYHSLEHVTKEDARQQFVHILTTLPSYLHIFQFGSRDTALYSVELDDMEFGSRDTALFFKMRVASYPYIFQFETKEKKFVQLFRHM